MLVLLHGTYYFCANSAEGAEQLPDNRGNGVRDPGAEDGVFWAQSAPGEDKVSLQSCHTRREGQGQNSSYRTVSCHLPLLYTKTIFILQFAGL